MFISIIHSMSFHNVRMVNGRPINLDFGNFRIMSLISDSENCINSDMMILENRLKSFTDNNWKLPFITPDQMANAGLYYLGILDRVRCVFCSREFDYWQPDDDPVIEHKRKSPRCPFFNGNQGNYLIPYNDTVIFSFFFR